MTYCTVKFFSLDEFFLRIYIAILIGAAALSCPQALNAQSVDSLAVAARRATENADSIRTYVLPEITVRAARSTLVPSAIPASVTILRAEDFVTASGASLASALAGAEGLVVQSYGGPAQVQTISLRGMRPEYTLILLNGIRLNSAQNGQADAGLISVADAAQVERVEIVRGGLSAIHGADAAGGVVNIVPRFPAGGYTVWVATAAGAAGYASASVTLGAGNESFAALISARREQGDGDYEFDFTDGKNVTRARRVGADFKTEQSSLNLRWRGGNLSGTAYAFYTNSRRGAPSAVTRVDQLSMSRLNDLTTAATTTLQWNGSPLLLPSLRISGLYADQRYTDPLLLFGGEPLSSWYVNRSVTVAPEARVALVGAQATFGAEWSESSLRSNEVLPARRAQASVFGSAEISVPMGDSFLYEAVIVPALRYDDVSGSYSGLSPRIGVSVGILREPNLRAKGSYGSGFRSPTFNDLYWIGGGNPHLKAERSVSADAGIAAEARMPNLITIPAGKIFAELTYFNIRTRDKIAWVPITTTVWGARNLGEISSQGIEASARWMSTDSVITFGIQSTWTDAAKTKEDYRGDPAVGKRLPYVPEQTASAFARVRLSVAEAAVRWRWESHKYTSESNTTFLPSYGIVSASVSVPFNVPAGESILTLRLRAEADNIFRESYMLIAGYPMPLFDWKVGITAEL